jgi:catecholate siderophore receptor
MSVRRRRPVAQALTQSAVLPLGAMAAGLGLSLSMLPAAAQTAATEQAAQALPNVTVKAKADKAPEAQQSYQTLTTTVGKGKQALRDIPQSVTVVTEKLMDDRNLDTLKEALKNTAGITFLAAEGGEEDIRLRGFSLQGTGDIFVDGIRDPAFYERDTFNLDRLEVLRGSASMLFGRGSTGGAVNQVSKAPFLMDAHEVSTTLGSHDYARVTGDFNFKIADEAAVRLNVMSTKADNNGAGSSLDKSGVAAALRWGIGTSNEFSASYYHLDNRNGMNYGLPWIKPTATSPNSTNTVLPVLSPDAYYGLDSDYNHGSANLFTFSHTHRLAPKAEIKTTLRQGSYTRDQRASAVRLCARTVNATTGVVTNPECPTTAVTLATLSPSTIVTRGSNNKVQNMDVLMLQSDLSASVTALGYRHDLLTGFDFASEQKTVFDLLTAVSKPKTTAAAGGGGSVNEGTRGTSPSSDYDSRGFGVYAQDLLQLTEHWKLLGGLRFDSLKAKYRTLDTGTGATTGTFDQSISEWSRRFGVLYQPTLQQSYHLSYGTSFNTSGDTYSYAGNTPAARERASNTPPESSENIELGAKLDWAEGRYTTRLALFHAVKKNERNTDATSVTGDSYLLSGKRHSTGFELDIAGKLTSKWEVYGSYTWIPEAEVDESASTSFGNRKGERPGLIPLYSGSLWSTYQITPQWRVGGGINFRGKQTPADVTSTSGVWSVKAYHTLDLMAEYTINQTFTLKANLSNLEDKLYADALYRGHYIPGPGRNVQLELVSKF